MGQPLGRDSLVEKWIGSEFFMPCHTMPCPVEPIRSWTQTLRPPGIRHRHLPCHAMPSAKVRGEHGGLGAPRVLGFGFLLIEISSRKAVPEVTSDLYRLQRRHGSARFRSQLWRLPLNLQHRHAEAHASGLSSGDYLSVYNNTRKCTLPVGRCAVGSASQSHVGCGGD